MKYVITIPQKEIVESGLLEHTDVVDWVIMDFLHEWAKVDGVLKVTIEEKEYVWVHLKTLIYNLPIVKINRAERISIRLGNLGKIGIIKRYYDKRGRLFVHSIDFGVFTRESMGGATCLPESKDQDKQNQQLEQIETPTLLPESQTSIIFNNNTSKDSKSIEDNTSVTRKTTFDPLKRFSELAVSEKREDLIPLYERWVCHLKDRRTPVKSKYAVELHFGKLVNFQNPKEVVDRCIELDYRGLFDNNVWSKPKKKRTEVGDEF